MGCVTGQALRRGTVWLGTVLVLSALGSRAEEGKKICMDCYISTGDNHWLGSSLPIDTPEAIDASFEFMKELGVRRVYWRGLEAATWVDGHVERPESCRYYQFWQWLRRLYLEVRPDQLAVAAARRHGLEIWGVATLVDWGSQADVPPFADYPFNSESRLRLEHPEWVPVDRYGVLRQGGPICFAYPEARRALVDLHLKFMLQDGYDGMTFLTYAENHSMRFQDEFGYNEPIVGAFRERHGIDIRFEDWTRFASRDDWIRLRGEYLTEFLRELKAELDKHGRKLGVVLQSWDPHKPQPWNVPELMLTAGHIYLDLETWVRDGIVDEFDTYGYCDSGMQARATRNMLWLTRGTETSVSLITSSPHADFWQSFRDGGVPMVAAWHDEAMYLARAGVPDQPLEALGSARTIERMKVLQQVIHGKSDATVAQLTPLARDGNLLVRRMALLALASTGDPAAVPAIEAALADGETTVRYVAIRALGQLHGPDSVARILEAVAAFPHHPMAEQARDALARIRPYQREVLAQAATAHALPMVRSVAMRGLVFMATPDLVPTFRSGLGDPDCFVRFAAAKGLGSVRRNEEAARVLIDALGHDDPVVSDRAATSLGEIVARGEEQTGQLTDEIVAALGTQYARLGDGCTRSDADWGYRPVGEALLACGAEGEAVLRRHFEQADDVRLAELAWKTLYIRKTPNSFSEVTETENAQAMSMRPASLRTRRFPRMSVDWDRSGLFAPEASGMVGDAAKRPGRWGPFGAKGPMVTSERSGKVGQAVKLVRGGDQLVGLVAQGVGGGADYELRVSLFRCETDSGLIVSVRGWAGAYRDDAGLLVRGSGALCILDAPSQRWVDAGVAVPASRWVTLVLGVNRRAATCRVRLTVDNEERAPVVTAPCGGVPQVKMVSLTPQGRSGTATLVDEVELIEIP